MKLANYKIKIVVVLSIVALLCFFTILIAQTSKGKLKNGEEIMQITAQVSKEVFKVGEPIVLNLKVKNNDDAELVVVQSCVSLDYRFTVKNERGQPIFLMKEGRRTNRAEIVCPLRKVKIESGEFKQSSIDLSSLYDMTAKG